MSHVNLSGHPNPTGSDLESIFVFTCISGISTNNTMASLVAVKPHLKRTTYVVNVLSGHSFHLQHQRSFVGLL